MAQRNRKRLKLSYVLREPEVEQRHCGQVNALQLSNSGGTLHTAGRDAVVRQWTINPDKLDEEVVHVRAFEGHSDWVNDIAVCENIGLLASVSSDRALKLWNTNEEEYQNPNECGTCVASLDKHTDYVKSVVYAPTTKSLFTAGLDCQVIMWDFGSGCVTDVCSWNAHAESIYAIAVNTLGNVIASGSVDKTMRLWDPRTENVFGCFTGHGDVIKTIAINEAGTRCLSGSSDNTMKYWDIGERRCIATYKMHTDSVWTLKPTADFSRVYSGGREGDVFVTNLSSGETESASTHLIHEENPVLKLEVDADETTMWVSTLKSAQVKRWKIPQSRSEIDELCSCGTLNSTPTLLKHTHLGDGLHVLTKASNDDVALWNVLTGTKVENLGPVDFDEEVKNRTIPHVVPKWCSFDTTLGALSVHLESDCFSAWAYGDKIPGITCKKDEKINLGGALLQALLRRYQDRANVEIYRKDHVEDEDVVANDQNKLAQRLHDEAVEKHTSHDYFRVNDEIRIVLTQTSAPQATLAQFTVATADTDESLTSLRVKSPDWMHRCLFFSKTEPFGDKCVLKKITVVLTPYKSEVDASKQLPVLSCTTVTMDSIFEINQVTELLIQKLPLARTASVVVYCLEKVLTGSTDIAFVKQQIWKKDGNPVLEYCLA